MDAPVGTFWLQTSVQQRRTWSYGSLPVSPAFVHLCGASTPKSLTLWDVSAVNALCLPKKGAGDREAFQLLHQSWTLGSNYTARPVPPGSRVMRQRFPRAVR